MRARNVLAAGLIALGAFAGTAPAYAHEAGPGNRGGVVIEIHSGGGGWSYDRLSPRELRRILRDQGYRLVEIRDRGRVYTVIAENHRGRDFVIRVNTRSGAILSVRPLRRWAGGTGHSGWGGGPGHGGWDGPRDGHGWGHRERCWLPEGCDRRSY